MTPPEIKTRLRSIKLEAAQLRATLRRLEPKASKPKQRKVRTTEERERARLYVAFTRDQPCCAACGRGPNDKPEWWRAPWMCNERAHVVNKPRVESVLAIIPLCTSCHAGSHGIKAAGSDLPPLSPGNLIYLKQQCDDYDEAFLRRHNGNRPLPAAEPLSVDYERSMYQFQGHRRDDEAMSH